MGIEAEFAEALSKYFVRDVFRRYAGIGQDATDAEFAEANAHAAKAVINQITTLREQAGGDEDILFRLMLRRGRDLRNEHMSRINRPSRDFDPIHYSKVYEAMAQQREAL